MIDNQISERIKKVIKNQNLTLSEVSTKIGFTETGFYKMLKNGDFKISTLQKIAEVLGLPVSYFFSESTESEHLGSIIRTIVPNNQIDSKEIEYLKRENTHLKQLLKAKEEIIELFKKLIPKTADDIVTDDDAVDYYLDIKKFSKFSEMELKLLKNKGVLSKKQYNEILSGSDWIYENDNE